MRHQYYLRIAGLFIVLFLIGTGIFAQSRTVRSGKYKDPFGVFSLTGGIGLAYYRGDLNNKVDMKNLNLGPSLSLGAMYRITEHFSGRGELRFYQVAGGPGTNTNLTFRTRNPDLNLGIQADLFAYNRQAVVNPYLYGGLGVTYLNPKAELNGQWYSLRPLTTELKAYNRLPLTVTGAIGVSIRASERLSLGLELNNTYCTSDYLDDVSGVYPDPDLLPSDLSRQLSDRAGEAGLTPQQPGWHRGASRLSDMYLFVQARATYQLRTRKEAKERKNTRCPKF